MRDRWRCSENLQGVGELGGKYAATSEGKSEPLAGSSGQHPCGSPLPAPLPDEGPRPGQRGKGHGHRRPSFPWAGTSGELVGGLPLRPSGGSPVFPPLLPASLLTGSHFLGLPGF